MIKGTENRDSGASSVCWYRGGKGGLRVLRSHNKPKYGKQEIAFRGLLTCACDNCTITAERKKRKYDYYRCTAVRHALDDHVIFTVWIAS